MSKMLKKLNRKWPGVHRVGPIEFRFGPESIPLNEAQWKFKLEQARLDSKIERDEMETHGR